MEGRLPETVLKGGAGSGVRRPRLVTAGSGERCILQDINSLARTNGPKRPFDRKVLFARVTNTRVGDRDYAERVREVDPRFHRPPQVLPPRMLSAACARR